MTNQSITVVFPCYNDKGTIATLVLEVRKVLRDMTSDFEIIVVEDGSSDGSMELLRDLETTVPELCVIYHGVNRGYGQVLRSGFAAAKKDLIFYTDGDAQYDVRELPLLVNALRDNVYVVSGFKIKRHDPLHRIIIGLIYQRAIRLIFWFPIRDPDCDFRLFRRHVFSKVDLTKNDGTVIIEMIKKIQRAGFTFAEVGVSHYARTYGHSQFFNFKRIGRTVVTLISLWFELFVIKNKKASS